MSYPYATDLVSTCSSLAKQALLGSQEVNEILRERVNEAGATTFQELRSLSTKFQQLNKAAEELQAGLRGALAIPAELQMALSTCLPKCDATTANVNKQLMRLGKDTPRDAISEATVCQYKAFADVTTRFLISTAQLLSSNVVPDHLQVKKLATPDAESLLTAVTAMNQDIAKSGGILLSSEATGYNASSLKQDVPDTGVPPAYPADDTPPPPFEDSSYRNVPAMTDADVDVDGHSNINRNSNSSSDSKTSKRSSSSSSFLSALASPFKAATAGLWTQPEPLVVPLCQAAANGDLVHLKSLLDEGANINGHNENGQTSLTCAIFASQVAAVQLLLDEGADFRRCDAARKGRPPLFHAVAASNKPIAELLLKHGAQPNQSNDMAEAYFVDLVLGDTAPQWIELLLRHGANATAKDMTGRPLIILAILKRKKIEDREEVVRLLLRYGAKPDSKDSDGTPLIYLCMQQKRTGLVYELLDKGADPHSRDVSGMPLLATAVKRNDHQLAKALLARRADPNATDMCGLHLIVNVLQDSRFPATDREALAELLLEHGARGDKNDLMGVTALELSLAPIIEGITAGPAPGMRLRIPDLLLKQGADPNQRLTKVSGEPTLLVYAVGRELWDLAALAFRHGANANLLDEKGSTPLLQAVQKGYADAILLLIKHGANINQPRQTLPLDVATELGHPEIIELLKKHGAVSSSDPVRNDNKVSVAPRRA